MKHLFQILALTFALFFAQAIQAHSCLPNGITFFHQADIDNLAVEHPNGMTIEGAVKVGVGYQYNDIVKLGLSNLSQIGYDLRINDNASLANIIGLSSVAGFNSLSLYNNPQLSICSTASGSCDDVSGFTKLGEYNGHGYYLSNDNKPWSQAKTLAENAGGYLATMNDQAENSYLQAHLNGNMVFIGFNDASSEGTVQWANGEPVTLDLSYANTAGHDYAVMNFWAGTWQMEQAGPWRKFIMEMDCGGESAPAHLEITNIECPSTYPFPNSDYTVTFEVSNTGGSASDPTTISFGQGMHYQTSGAQSAAKYSFVVPAIAAGESIVMTKTFQLENSFLPGDFAPASASYTVIFGDLGFFMPDDTPWTTQYLDYSYDYYCKKYSTDLAIAISSDDLTYSDGDDSVYYQVTVTNNGTETAYNFGAYVDKHMGLSGVASGRAEILTEGETVWYANSGVLWYMESLAPGASKMVDVRFWTMASGPEEDIEVSIYAGHNIDPVASNDEASLHFEREGQSGCADVSGFTKLGEYNGHGYYLSNDNKPWSQAKTLAENAGGYLATMNDQAENSYLQAHLNGNMVFIGFNDASSEGTVQWANGEPVTLDLSYANTAGHDYAVMNFWAGTWQMEQAGPWRKFIMEMDCGGESTPAHLEITNIECPSTYPFPNSDYTVTFEVANTGGSASDPTTISFGQGMYYQTSGAQSAAKYSFVVPAIAAGESIVMTKTFQLENSFLPGDFAPTFASNVVFFGDLGFFMPDDTPWTTQYLDYSYDYYCKKYSTDLAIAISSDNLTYSEGDDYVYYQVTVTNNGTETAYNFGAYVDKHIGLSGGASGRAEILTEGETVWYASSGVLWYMESLAPGASKMVDVRFWTIASGPEEDIEVSIYAGHNIDPVASNDEASLHFERKGQGGCANVSGFTKLGEYNGHGYYLSNDNKPWSQAKTLAENAGGYLATMNDQAENSYLQAHLNGNMVFIGFNDASSEGTVQWANGEPVTLDLSYANTAGHDYAVMNFWAGTWQMEQAGPWRKFIMEMDCNGSLPQPIATPIFIDMDVYPNPATEEITVQILAKKDEAIQLVVFNAQGKEVMTTVNSLIKGINKISLTVSGFEQGMYFLKAIGSDTEKTIRFVKIN